MIVNDACESLPITNVNDSQLMHVNHCQLQMWMIVNDACESLPITNVNDSQRCMWIIANYKCEW
jgi:hypothetical protein